LIIKKEKFIMANNIQAEYLLTIQPTGNLLMKTYSKKPAFICSKMTMIKSVLWAFLVALIIGGCSSENGNQENYSLYAPSISTLMYLLNESGEVVYQWPSEYFAGQSAFLQDDGSIIRAGAINNVDPDNRFVKGYTDSGNSTFQVGGIVERISKEGEVVWSFEHYSDDFAPHHVVTVMPNGNLLMPLWRYYTEEECIALGRNPENLTSGGLWIDSIIEVKPVGNNSGEIVWEWNSVDHMTQDFDPTKANFGILANNPGKIDINYGNGLNIPEDFMHVNSAYYIEEFDQIVFSTYHYSELWVIDHSTTTEEAAGNTGGKYGKGGDLLYRWGNPYVYGRGDADVFLLSAVHDPKWVSEEGRFIMYDNNIFDPTRGLMGGNSMVVEIEPPITSDGSYILGENGVYGPEQPIVASDLGVAAGSVGTAHRLDDGRTLSCDCTNSLAIWLDTGGAVIETRDFFDEAMVDSDDDQVFRLVSYPRNNPGVKALQF